MSDLLVVQRLVEQVDGAVGADGSELAGRVWVGARRELLVVTPPVLVLDYAVQIHVLVRVVEVHVALKVGDGDARVGLGAGRVTNVDRCGCEVSPSLLEAGSLQVLILRTNHRSGAEFWLGSLGGLLTLARLDLVFLDVTLGIVLVDDRPSASVCVVEGAKGAVGIDIEVGNCTNIAGRQLIFINLELSRIRASL